MSTYTDHDELAADVLQLVEDIQDQDPNRSFARLVLRCQNDPAQMTQMFMCLAIWMDPDTPVSVLVARAEAIAGVAA